MADGKWVMTDEDAKRVDMTFSGSARTDLRELPNYGERLTEMCHVLILYPILTIFAIDFIYFFISICT